MQYNTIDLSISEKLTILYTAKELCYNWWVDILDYKVSFCRQKFELSFEDIIDKWKKSNGYDHYLSVIHRNFHPENHLEVGFRIFGKPNEPDYFLWILVKPEYIPEIIKGLKPYVL